MVSVSQPEVEIETHAIWQRWGRCAVENSRAEFVSKDCDNSVWLEDYFSTKMDSD